MHVGTMCVRVHSVNNVPYQPWNLETRSVLAAYLRFNRQRLNETAKNRLVQSLQPPEQLGSVPDSEHCLQSALVRCGYDVGTTWVPCGYDAGTMWVRCRYDGDRISIGYNVGARWIMAAPYGAAGEARVGKLKPPYAPFTPHCNSCSTPLRTI